MSFVFKPTWQAEGEGAKVLRIIGNKFLKNLDPFLMLDMARVRLPVGFPDHPHRGFQTVSYSISGSFYHEDSKGRRGKTGPGDVQWMTAGKGILHSEMPASFEEDSVGFQLWINLQSKNKMIQPKYQEYQNQNIKVVQKDQAKIKIIAGKWEGQEGPIIAKTPSYYFDVTIQEKGNFTLPITSSWNSIIFVFQGEVKYQGKTIVQKDHCCVLEKSTKQLQISHSFTSDVGGRFILISGEPLNEPISQHGPFVMNTKQQIEEAFSDFYNEKNGFENTKNWKSRIQNLKKGKKIQELWNDK